jgi:hypothetical protein
MNFQWRFHLGGVSAYETVQGSWGRGCLWGWAEASERSASEAGGEVIETALIFFLPILFVSRQKEWE